jgi:hypothetical protein
VIATEKLKKKGDFSLDATTSRRHKGEMLVFAIYNSRKTDRHRPHQASMASAKKLDEHTSALPAP